MKAGPLALPLAVAFLLAACGGAGSNQQGDDSGSGGHGRMDNGQMGHGSMGMGSGGMARQMVMEKGKYSDKAFIDAMVPHHQGAIAMAEVALVAQRAPGPVDARLVDHLFGTDRLVRGRLRAIGCAGQ